VAKRFRAKLSISGLSVTVDVFNNSNQLIAADLNAIEIESTSVYAIGNLQDTAEWALFKSGLERVPVYESPEDVVAGMKEGDGTVLVDHNTGGADNLRYVYNDEGVNRASIIAYIKSDYDSKIFNSQGRTYTDAQGRWLRPLSLIQGFTYIIVFEKPGAFGPDVTEVTV